MIFPTIDSALEYLRSKLQDFYAQSRVLRDRLLEIGRLLKIAKEKNDQAAIGRLIVLRSQTEELFREHLDLEQKLAPVAEYFGVPTGLGAIPLALIATGIGLAGAVYLHFQKLQNQKQALDLVARGLLSPEEAKQFMEAGSILGAGGLTGLTRNLGVIAALLVGGLIFWQLSARKA